VLLAEAALQFLPELPTAEYARLKQSIADHGVLIPIQVTPDGLILDGHHRARACAELGLVCPTVVVDVPEEKRWDWIFVVNVARRHMSVAERLDLVREYLRRHAGESNRAIASLAGTSDHTVSKVRLEETGELSPDAEQRALARSRQSDYQEASENHADHRNETYIELVIGYAAESEAERTRAGLPYPQASERLRWESGRLYLTTPAPRSDQEFGALLIELARRLQREVAQRPLRTMVRG
jgi:ParB-like chromosome segregation protein Spo0J